MEMSEGFPPIARHDARILILGSLPGRRSIAEREYYAHPQNAFWPIMRAVFGVDGEYTLRCDQLRDRGVAVWDVLGASRRPGSLDADIDVASARPNDFAGFLARHPGIDRIGFNGKKAEQLFGRFVALPEKSEIRTIGLPSTSPAYASMPFSGKLERWKMALVNGD